MTTPQYLIEDTPEELAAAAARQAAWAQRILKHERCSHEAEAKAVPAFARLLDLAETRNSGQIRTVVQFIAATYNGRAWRFDPFDLRGLDVAIGDDMLACLDCLRWATSDLYRLVPNGDARIQAMLRAWGLIAVVQ